MSVALLQFRKDKEKRGLKPSTLSLDAEVCGQGRGTGPGSILWLVQWPMLWAAASGGVRLPEKDPRLLKALVSLPSAPSVILSSGKSHIHVVFGKGGRFRGQAVAEHSQVTPCETVTVAVKCSRRRIS